MRHGPIPGGRTGNDGEIPTKSSTERTNARDAASRPLPPDSQAVAYRHARFYERWAATLLDAALIAAVAVVGLLLAQLIAWLPVLGGLLGLFDFTLLLPLMRVGAASVICEDRATSRQSWVHAATGHRAGVHAQ